eukprot:scaffold85601_cov31-Tisochrysis_lutea.AAC.4
MGLAKSSSYVSPVAIASFASVIAPVRNGHFRAQRCRKICSGGPSCDGQLLDGVGQPTSLIESR